MSQTSLSYEQAPPFSLPLRFFITAPLFLLLAAAVAIPTAPAWLASRWSPEALALTHLLTLGFLGQVMVGSLLQRLPVVIGSPVPWPWGTARLGHMGLTGGAVLLALGLGLGESTLMWAAMGLLAVGWFPFLATSAISLYRAHPMDRATLHAMRLAWACLMVTLGLGFWLAGGLSGLWHPGDVAVLTDMHASWGLLGWVLILVIGVAYQVVPMLQITPPYPRWAMASLVWLVLAGILLLGLDGLSHAAVWAGWGILPWLPVMGAMAAFALLTLDLQRRSRRRLADATRSFWRLGLASLLVLTAMPPVFAFWPQAGRPPLEVAGGLLFLLGFATSVVNGMLYKIVPFLSWFHLQGQTGARAGTIPNMKEFLPEPRARLQYRFHLAAVLLLLPTPWLPAVLAAPGLLALGMSALLLWRNLWHCARLFRRHGGDFQAITRRDSRSHALL